MFSKLLQRETNKRPLVILYENSLLNSILSFFAERSIFPYRVVFDRNILDEFDYMCDLDAQSPNYGDELIAFVRSVAHIDSDNVPNALNAMKAYNELKEACLDIPDVSYESNTLLNSFTQIVEKFENMVPMSTSARRAKILQKLSEEYEIFEVGILIKPKFFSQHIISVSESFSFSNEFNKIDLSNISYCQVSGVYHEYKMISSFNKIYSNLAVVYAKSNMLFSKLGNVVMLIINAFLYGADIKSILSSGVVQENRAQDVEMICSDIKNFSMVFDCLCDDYKTDDNRFVLDEIDSLIGRVYNLGLERHMYQLVEAVLSHIQRNNFDFNIYNLHAMSFARNKRILLSDQAFKKKRLDYLPNELRIKLNLLTKEDLDRIVDFSFMNIAKNNDLIFISRERNKFFVMLQNAKDPIDINMFYWKFVGFYYFVYKTYPYEQDDDYLLSNVRAVSFTALSLAVQNPYRFYLIHVLKCKYSSVCKSESATYGIDLHDLFDKYNKLYNDLSEKSRIDLLYEFEHKNNFDDFDAFVRAFVQFDQERRRNSMKISTEEYIEAKISKTKLYGYIDRLEFALNNDISLIDFKTGAMPSGADIDRGLDMQLLSQSYAIEQKYGRLPEFVCYVKVSYNYPYISVKKIKINWSRLDMLKKTIELLENKYVNFKGLKSVLA